MKYPVSQPYIIKPEYALDAINKGWISSAGDYIEKFESAWADYNKQKFAVSCNSGTNALYLALKALQIKEGDEVIVPEFTMVATAWAVTYCGAKPVFVDCGDDLNIDVKKIEEKITKNTKVIMPVHIYGRQANMKEIMRIAYEYNLYVVEDMAEAHGIMPMGDIACYSFYGNKIITTGEGGMCLTNNKKWAEQMKHYRSMAFDVEHTFLHKKIGFNFRMTNMQAGIGLGQVEVIDEILEKRKQIESWYDKYIDEEYKMPKRDVLWMYDVMTRNNTYIYNKLKGFGIESRLFFKPMSMQPMYLDEYKNLKAYDKSWKGLYLPTYPQLTEEDVKYISNIFNKVNEENIDPYLQTI